MIEVTDEIKKGMVILDFDYSELSIEDLEDLINRGKEISKKYGGDPRKIDYGLENDDKATSEDYLAVGAYLHYLVIERGDLDLDDLDDSEE